MNGLHFLFIGIALSMMILVTGCNTPYITKDGERLLSNSVVGCAVGQEDGQTFQWYDLHKRRNRQ